MPRSHDGDLEPSGRASEDTPELSSPAPLEQLAAELSSAVVPFAGPGRLLDNFGEHKVLLDATSKFLIRDDAGIPEFVVLCSSEGGPEIVARGVQRAREMVDALGDELGRAVLLPVGEGEVSTRTFAVFRYCTPLIGSGPMWRVQRSIVRPRIVRWLLASARSTAVAVSDHELEQCVHQPLEQLAADAGHSEDLRALADSALRAARVGAWQPRHVFMHDDLWHGNVLIDRRATEGHRFGRFVIIDWAGSRVRGYPLYDFLRLSTSFGLSGRSFFRALDRYCDGLGYSRTEGGYAFAHAAAELGQRLEQWPRPSYLATIDRCYQQFVSGR